MQGVEWNRGKTCDVRSSRLFTLLAQSLVKHPYWRVAKSLAFNIVGAKPSEAPTEGQQSQ
jgi:hypothetical protein